MKKTIISFFMGIIITAVFFIIVNAVPAEDDSLKVILSRLEQYMKSEIGKTDRAGRYQLQSFTIDRTHWHYVLDTATGELYRLEPSRTPENSKWTLMAAANFGKP